MQLERELEVAYSHVVAISVEAPEIAKETRTALGASFPILSDQDRRWQQALDLEEYTDQKHRPYIPYTFLLEPGRVIYKIYNGYWFWGRPTMEDLRQDFRAISMRCRSDWDPQAPGVREVWEAARVEGVRLPAAEFRQRLQEWRRERGV